MAEKPLWLQEMERAQREIESARNEQLKMQRENNRSGETQESLKRKAHNTAIKHSAQATQNTLNARKQSGKTRIGPLARGGRGGGMLGGGLMDMNR